MGAENALYIILIEKIRQDALVLPTLPEVALKVRQAADDPDISLMKMSEIISHDAALSLGVLKVANSAAFGREVKVESVAKAVTRIGLRQIKNIATAMAIEQMFVSNNHFISDYMQKSWRKTVDVASVAIALMTLYLQKNKQSELTLETLTLAALIHNIGVLPILTEAEGHPEVFANPAFLNKAIIKFSNEIAAEMTKAWEFSEDYSELVMTWNDLSVLPKNAHYIDFIRAGAVYHSIFKNESTQEFLLRSYVDKGILPNLNFMASEDFSDRLAKAKSMF
ncbi:HDOD domain-containing protein [Colwellia sp. Arc7-D]|jgi:HD-like signal output (HDOD) protein|uniref:HDOD domain-containing protein n=1 Tax=Colwellia sp. Arc7-D TaxID=2161872 RepID=UPI000D3C2DF8|nr:HDOD domain-containing protein [Colwellia sp. Arc7-D]AWB58662.1 histidine kinase [Colwellia sp. Arc7-D]|tara:strand:- start:3352 stop:4191 length:840 start_codon:yes stop_codon:yes gene_type:complete